MVVENKMIWSEKGMYWIQRKRLNPFIEEVSVNFPSKSQSGVVKTVKQKFPRGSSNIVSKLLGLLLV